MICDERLETLTDRSDLLAGDPKILRDAFANEGVLYFKRYLPRADVLDLRAGYFSLFDPEFLKSGTEPVDGIYSGKQLGSTQPYGTQGHPAWTFVRSEQYQTFVNQDALQKISARILGGPVRRLKRSPLRHFARGEGKPTPAHRDIEYLAEGTPHIVTVWIPIGDCPRESGGLIYLADSHKMDIQQLRSSASPLAGKPNALTAELQELSESVDRPWLVADYQAGDIVIHCPTIVHASLPVTTEAMRVSTDIRFIRTSDAVDSKWTRDWSADDGY